MHLPRLIGLSTQDRLNSCKWQALGACVFLTSIMSTNEIRYRSPPKNKEKITYYRERRISHARDAGDEDEYDFPGQWRGHKVESSPKREEEYDKQSVESQETGYTWRNRLRAISLERPTFRFPVLDKGTFRTTKNADTRDVKAGIDDMMTFLVVLVLDITKSTLQLLKQPMYVYGLLLQVLAIANSIKAL